MKKVKAVFWLLVICFVALVVYQNLDYFLGKESLDINLYFKRYQTPELANGVLILGCFLIGFLAAYVISLSERFKARKAVKSMNATVDSHLEQISALRHEIEVIKRGEPVPDPEPPETFETRQGT
jgi:mannose/fructose/N-acetylgalactosamine-specific phosphotransferase system component IID